MRTLLNLPMWALLSIKLWGFRKLLTMAEEQTQDALSLVCSSWLLTSAEHSTLSPDTEASKLLFKTAEEMANQRLADASNRYLIPENLDWAAAGWTVSN